MLSEKVNNINCYFLESPVTAKYVRIVGYGNSSTLYYPFTNFNEIGFNEPAGNVFSDVTDHWAKDYVMEQSTGVIASGYADGTFKPDNSIGRSEFAKMVTLATYTYNDPYDTTDVFSDVAKGSWYMSYIYAAKAYGIMNGISDTEFGVGKAISRQDAATAIARALVLVQKFVMPTDEEANTILAQFSDKAEIADYAKASVAMLVREGIVNGYNESDGRTLRPTSDVKRGEACKLLSDAVKAKVVKQIADAQIK
jgi:endo-1,4-beta-xylanase